MWGRSLPEWFPATVMLGTMDSLAIEAQLFGWTAVTALRLLEIAIASALNR
jgi:hypothetical protein